MYEIVTSFIAIIVGIICIFFRKQLVSLQKKMVSKHTNYISRTILEYPTEDAIKMAVIVGIISIIMGLLKLFQITNSV